ncbi:hypothetical protein NVS55_18395 [Myxococcus stipitatus]|uniref:YncE family protein n=1 Tax=Myxococcus stipitatus TaxID=83455 RepID=UPI003144F0E8
MNQRWLGLLLGAVLWSPAVLAHDFRAEKLVNGVKQARVVSYPATLSFTFTATNIHPTLDSILLTAMDPLLTACTLSPAPPLTVPVGGHVTYQCEFTIPTYEACIALGELDTNPSTPNEEVSFTNVFSISWDNGAAQDGVNVLCVQERIRECDDTVYISTASSTGGGLPSAPSHLFTFDPVAGTLSPLGDAGVPYNALAFNHIDGFLYAIAADGVNPPNFIRIDANGSAQVIAPVVSGAANSAVWAAGAVLGDGTYLGYESQSNHLVRINTTTGAVLSDVVVGTTLTFAVADFAVNPLSGLLYGFNGATQRVTVIDPVVGTFVDFLLPTEINGIRSVGNTMVSAIFSSAGQLFFYGTTNANNSLANTFYAVNLVTGAFTVVSNGPTTQFADGATCAFPPPPPAVRPPKVTRDHAFFGSNDAALRECLSKGPVELGGLGKVTSPEVALGVLWANPVISKRGEVRSEVESLKVKIARELLTATCNQRCFGTVAPEVAGLDIGQALGTLAKHNRSGSDKAVPLSKEGWKLDPLPAQARAVEPRY